LIHINIEIKKPNRFRNISKKFFSKLEDFIFSIIQRLPDKLLPSILISWLNRYTDKRISELQHQIFRTNGDLQISTMPLIPSSKKIITYRIISIGD